MYLYQYTNTIERNISDIIFYKYFNINIEKIKILTNNFQIVQKFQLPNILVTHYMQYVRYTKYKTFQRI